MFGLRKRGGPDKAFSHASDCKLVKINPEIKIPWNEIETGVWVAECRCGKQYVHEALADGRVRLDPLDPSTFRHTPACPQRDVTDPAILKATLRVQEREGYWWVENAMCPCCWQTPYVAAESVG